MASRPAADSLGNTDKDKVLFSEHISILGRKFWVMISSELLAVLSPGALLTGADAVSLYLQNAPQIFKEMMIQFSGPVAFFERFKWISLVPTSIHVSHMLDQEGTAGIQLTAKVMLSRVSGVPLKEKKSYETKPHTELP